jgi:hypothetical protein
MNTMKKKKEEILIEFSRFIYTSFIMSQTSWVFQNKHLWRGK